MRSISLKVLDKTYMYIKIIQKRTGCFSFHLVNPGYKERGVSNIYISIYREKSSQKAIGLET